MTVEGGEKDFLDRERSVHERGVLEDFGSGRIGEEKGLLVEIHEDFQLQISDSAKYLTAAGLEFIEKRNAETDKNSLGARSFNQIWRRPASN